jgi:hypothetical protein
LKRAPEFEAWLHAMQVSDHTGMLQAYANQPAMIE